MAREIRIQRDQSTNEYSPENIPVATATSGEVVVFDSHDTRSGSLLSIPSNEPFELSRPNRARGNPVTGPLFVEGAMPGDGLLVEILSIVTGGKGWVGAHAHVGPIPQGRIASAFGRTCDVTAQGVHYSEEIVLPLAPMLGCIGTAPAVGVASTQLAGRHGGNMDQKTIVAGTRLLLPVQVAGALLSIGDVHATQGDGELSGIALEIPAETTVRVTVVKGQAPAWPWLLSDDRVSVLTAGADFADAAAAAVSEGISLLEHRLGTSPGDALALLSVSSDIRIGAAWGGPQVTARLEIPRSLGALPAGF